MPPATSPRPTAPVRVIGATSRLECVPDLSHPLHFCRSGGEGYAFLAKRGTEWVVVKLVFDCDAHQIQKWRNLIELMGDFEGIARPLELAKDANDNKTIVGLIVGFAPGKNLLDILDGQRLWGLPLRDKLRICWSLARIFEQFTRLPATTQIISTDRVLQNFNLDLTTFEVTSFDHDSDWLLKGKGLSGRLENQRGAYGTVGGIPPERLRDKDTTPTLEGMWWNLAVLCFYVTHGVHPATLKLTADTQGVSEDEMVLENFYPKFSPADPKRPVPDYDPESRHVEPALHELLRRGLTSPPDQRPTPDEWLAYFDGYFARYSRRPWGLRWRLPTMQLRLPRVTRPKLPRVPSRRQAAYALALSLMVPLGLAAKNYAIRPAQQTPADSPKPSPVTPGVDIDPNSLFTPGRPR